MKKCSDILFLTLVIVLCVIIGVNRKTKIKYQQPAVRVSHSASPQLCIRKIEIKVSRMTEVEAMEKLASVKAGDDANKVGNDAIEQTNDDDLYCLAAVICQEAGACSDETKALVGNVVLNRVESGIFPNSIREVITQYGQYGMMWKNGVSFPKYADEKCISECFEVAEKLLNGMRVCDKNVIFQAEFIQGNGVFKFAEGIYFCYG